MDWNPSSYPRGRGAMRLIRTGRKAELVLDNPEARNAVRVGMMVDLLTAVDDLAADPPTVLIVHGAGDAGFCAGGDLREVRAHLMDDQTPAGMPLVIGDALDRLATLPTAIVAAVEGVAVGGGAELSQVADWVVLAESAKIGFVHASLGVSPGWGGARRLIARVGHRAATEVLLHARSYRGDEARLRGLADEIVPNGQALTSAEEWASRVLSVPSASTQGALQILRAARRDPGSTRVVEAEVFARLWGGPAHQEALKKIKAGG